MYIQLIKVLSSVKGYFLGYFPYSYVYIIYKIMKKNNCSKFELKF